MVPIPLAGKLLWSACTTGKWQNRKCRLHTPGAADQIPHRQHAMETRNAVAKVTYWLHADLQRGRFVR